MIPSIRFMYRLQHARHHQADSVSRCRITTGIACIALLSLSLGCASWSIWDERSDEQNGEPAAKLPLRKVSRTIELESEFVQIRFDPTDPDQLQSMWQWVDETVVPIGTRKVLQQNGLRIGKANHPERLVRRLEALERGEEEDVVDTFLSSASVASHQSEGMKTIPMRLGKRYELPVRLPIQGDQIVMIHADPQPIGRTLRDPQFLFALTPQAGTALGEINIRVRPEVQHGEMRQDWVQGDAALRIDVRRQSWSLDTMEFELLGTEGDLFVISETETRRGIGQLMLGGKNVNQLEQQTVLLLRVANIPTPAEKL